MNFEIVSVFITHTETGQGKGRREAICLPLEFLPGWLVGIDAARGKPELKEKITRYRRECYRVLAEGFKAETLPFASERNSADFPSREPNPVLMQIREQGFGETAVPRPQTPAFPTITIAFGKAIRDIIDGKDVKAALDAAVKTIDQDIKDNQGYKK